MSQYFLLRFNFKMVVVLFEMWLELIIIFLTIGIQAVNTRSKKTRQESDFN